MCKTDPLMRNTLFLLRGAEKKAPDKYFYVCLKSTVTHCQINSSQAHTHTWITSYRCNEIACTAIYTHCSFSVEQRLLIQMPRMSCERARCSCRTGCGPPPTSFISPCMHTFARSCTSCIHIIPIVQTRRCSGDDRFPVSCRSSSGHF